MHHPWRRLRDHLPDWSVVYEYAVSGVWGDTDAHSRTIRVDPDLLQAERRCTLDHELIHAEHGDVGPQPPAREAWVNRTSARRMITVDQLVNAVLWAHDMEELADELWVDVETAQCRIDNLTDGERAIVRRAIAVRDFHDEGRGIDQ